MDSDAPLAVLISGGIDSAILLGDALANHRAVHPVFVRFGLYWESAELAHLQRFLRALACPVLQPLTILDQPVANIYGKHWSLTGRNVPDADTPDEAVYLPGRNLLLLTPTAVWCRLNDVDAVALGSLQSNPFPDATPRFFRAFEKTANQALGGRLQVCLPFSGMKKKAVIRLGRHLPLQHTFSCIQPRAKHHCGACNKCAERQKAFTEAGLDDPTPYQHSI